MKYKFNIHDLDCANCATKIEKRLNETPDIDKAIVNFSKLTLTVETNHSGSVKDYLESVIQEIEPDITISLPEDSHNHDHKTTTTDIITLVLGLILGALGMYLLKGTISKIFIIISYILLLYKIVIKAIKQLKTLSIDENLLITLVNLSKT